MADSVRARRRAEIIAAARTLVAEQGLDALTFRALEAALSFTRGVITYHFHDKEDLVRAVFTSAVDEIDAAVRAEVRAQADVDDQVRAILRANVRGFVDRAEAGRVLLSMWGRLSSDPEARAVNADLFARYRRRSAKLLKRAKEQGAVADISPKTVAALLVALVLGIATQHYFDPGAIDVDEAIDEACRTVLARLHPRPPRAG